MVQLSLFSLIPLGALLATEVFATSQAHGLTRSRLGKRCRAGGNPNNSSLAAVQHIKAAQPSIQIPPVSNLVTSDSATSTQTSSTAAWTPSTTWSSSSEAWSPSPSASPSPSSGGSGGGSGSSGPAQTGIATFFTQNGNAGACGNYNSDSAYIVAMYTPQYNNGANCGKTLSITGNGQTIQATVADECPSCNGPGCLDMSTGLFAAFGVSQNTGTFDISWTCDDCDL